MATVVVPLAVLRTLIFLLFATWFTLWFLKPTEIWSKKWHKVEDVKQPTIIKYNGADFVVYTLPILLLAMVGFVYLYLQPRSSIIKRRLSRRATVLHNPLIIRSPVGVLSSLDILLMSSLLCLLAWTFYIKVSKDYKKLVPAAKPLKLNIWQLKFLSISTRFGLLAEICLAALLFPVLRGASIFRLLGVQFEASARYHIWLGTLLVVFGTLHGVGTLFIWGINHHIQDQIWKWQKDGRIYLAGVIALVTALVIWISSLPLVRRRNFQAFFYMHHLYIVFIAFFLFHAGDRHFYMVFPGIFLFGLDKLLRIIQSRAEIHILSVRIFPNKVMELTFPKDPGLKYAPTSIVFAKIPMISKFDWHPFSITSSSMVDSRTMSVMIKCEGCWTSSLYNMLCRELESSHGNTKHIAAAVEGPYGPASFELMRYDNLILVAGGIGITPMLSVLQEIASARDGPVNTFPMKIQLIYVSKKSQDISLLDSISHLILDKSSKFHDLKLKVFITQEEKGGSSLRELLKEFSVDRSMQFDRKSSNVISGPENLLCMAAFTAISSVIFLLILCFFNIFVRPEKKPSKLKTPSTVVDLFLLLSFLIAITSSAVVAMLLRSRNSKEQTISTTWDREDKARKLSLIDDITGLDEHEIYYKGRPIFTDLLSQLRSGFGESSVGVVVCGPESMKESVALACQQQKHNAVKLVPKQQQPFYVFHSLNFTL